MIFRQLFPCRNRFGCHGPAISNHHLAVIARFTQPITTRNNVGLGRIRKVTLRLAQWLGRQAHVNRPAVLGLHMIKRPAHDRGNFIAKAWLKAGQARLAHADHRRADRLVRTTFRCERNAAWCGDNHKPCILITGVIQRIQTARNERIIQRANREQSLPKQAVRQTKGGQIQKQIVFGNTQFDMLPAWRTYPFLGRRNLAFAKLIDKVFAAKQSALVHKPAKVGRHRHIRRCRHNTIRQIAVFHLGQFIEDFTKHFLRA